MERERETKSEVRGERERDLVAVQDSNIHFHHCPVPPKFVGGSVQTHPLCNRLRRRRLRRRRRRRRKEEKKKEDKGKRMEEGEKEREEGEEMRVKEEEEKEE